MTSEPAWNTVLRGLREARGISQDGWAARLGVSRSTVQRWESGAIVPDVFGEEALIAFCAEQGLLLREGERAVSGRGTTTATLRALLAQARRQASGASVAERAEPAVESARLPVSLTSFLGRERELADLRRLLGSQRLVTLTGPGGTGKTRLALAAAAEARAEFPDGVWFVDLSGVADSAGVIPAIAALLAVRESEGRSLAVSLAAYLRRKRLLLVLDNFEQVIAASLALYDLLTEAPALSLLVTSRILLRVGGEQEYAVPPLPTPEVAAHADPAALRESPAVQLFLDRAHALRPDLALSAESLAAIGAICARLDGLPLAIELAAARVKLLSPGQLLARLERRLPLLTGGARSLPARQQTLRATIQWSWDLLNLAEQALFRRLAVFAGGFTLAAAEAVCNAAGELDVLEALTALVDQSLVRQRELNGEPRFRLLATLQEFALEQLEEAREADSLHRAHAAYYATLADDAQAAYWHSGRLQHDVLRPLDPERDNLFRAMSWTLAQQEATIGLRLGGGLGRWFFLRAPGEGRRWLERLLALPGAAAPDSARGRALAAVASCALAGGDLVAIVAYYEAAASSLREEEDLPTLSRALAMLGACLPATAIDRALALGEEALQLAQALGDKHNHAVVEALVGAALFLRGRDRAAVRAHVEEALRLARALDADWLPMYALTTLAQVAEVEGQLERASALFRAALPLVEALGDRINAANARHGLAQLAAAAGDFDEAAVQWRQALMLAQELDSASAMALCLAGTAGVLSAQQRYEPAVQLLAASDRRRQAAEQHSFFGPRFAAVFTPTLAATREALSAEAFAQAWAAGQALSLDEAADLALAELAAVLPATG